MRGYHVYQDVWTSQNDEVLPCEREGNNVYDSFAVSVNKEDDVVGTNQERSPLFATCFLVNQYPITCKVARSQRYSSDVLQGGLEISCIIEFRGDKSAILKEKIIK